MKQVNVFGFMCFSFDKKRVGFKKLTLDV